MGFSYRQIAKDYKQAFPGEKISHQRIATMAKSSKWKKDLSEDYEAAVDRKVIERAKGVDTVDTVDGSDKSDEEAVEDAAEVAATTVTDHRERAKDLRLAASKIIAEVDENEAMEVLTRNGDKVTIHLDVNKRASALNQASRALTAAVDIERKSLNLDRKDGISFGGGSITIVSNVPEPLPLPPGI
jgi:hypothetical protein